MGISPTDYGVGARFTLSVMDSNYVETILTALEKADKTGLTLKTNDISTFVGGSEQRIIEFVHSVVSSAAASGAHLSVSLLLSRGCPGELVCALPPGVAALGAEPVSLPKTGQRARAHWSLYSLLNAAAGTDASAADGADTPAATDHMEPIYAAIEQAKRDGVFSGSDHFATRLDGDLGAVLETIANAWIAVGERVQHVTTHVTISMNSPTPIND